MKHWIGVLMVGLMVLGMGCSSPEQEESPADKVAKKESLPAPSSLVENEETKLILTAHELVKGISGNDIKQTLNSTLGSTPKLQG